MNSAQTVVETDLNYIYRMLEDEWPILSGKKILISGGAGFLGYYLVHSIIYYNTSAAKQSKIKLTVYDNFSRGYPAWLSRLEKDHNLSVLKHDIREPLPSNVDDFLYIIHAACIASPVYYRQKPIGTMDANVNGLRFLLEYSLRQKVKENPVKGFLFFSTSEIYGDPSPEYIPTSENYRGNVSCTGPRACYDESKRYGETLCVNFARQYSLPIKIVRPFNNYGPGLKITDRRVIPDYSRDIFAGLDIVMLSDGSPSRTFCYVADAVVGYFKILTRGRSGEAYNIGAESPEVTMANLAERMVTIAGKLFGYDGRVIHQVSSDKDYLIDNPNRRCPDITKARHELGYNPGITLDEGLRRSLLWYRDNYEAEAS